MLSRAAEPPSSNVGASPVARAHRGAPGRRNATVATDRGSAPGDASACSRSCCTSAADA